MTRKSVNTEVMHTHTQNKPQTPELPSSCIPHRVGKAKVKTAPLDTMNVYTGERKYTSTQSCIRYWWWSVVTFMPWPLYSRRKSTRYSLNRRMSGSQSQSTLFEGEKNLLPLLEVEWRLLCCTFRSSVNKGTAQCRLFNALCFLITNLWTFGKRCSSIHWMELSPRRTALFHKIRVYYQIKKLPAFYRKRTSLPAESRSTSICLVTWIQHTPYNPTYLIPTLVIHWFIIRFGLQCGVSSIHII